MSETAATSVEVKDFFISYASPDKAWALWINDQLRRAGYSTIVQHLDFAPGQSFVHRMHLAAQQATRTIAVLSPSYFQSRWTGPEWNAAWVRDPNGDKSLLIPVRVRSCDPPGLLKTISYIDLVEQNEANASRILLDSLGRAGILGTAQPEMAEVPPSFPETSPSAGGERADQDVEIAPEQQDPGIEVTCPETLYGLGKGKIRWRFPDNLSEVIVQLAFDVKTFVVSGDGQSANRTEFHYRFPAAGSRSKTIEIRAKRTDNANHGLILRCMNPAGEVLLQEHLIICLTERRPLRWPIVAAVCVASLAAAGAYVGFNPELSTRLNKRVLRPDYLDAASAGWEEWFEPGAFVESKWNCSQPACQENRAAYPNGGLTLRPGGIAAPRVEFARRVLYDFQYRFVLTLADASEAAWLVRARKSFWSGDDRKFAGYLFVFRRSSEGGSTTFSLSGFNCPDLGTCQTRLRTSARDSLSLKGGTGSLGSNTCTAAANSEFEIQGEANGARLTVSSTVLGPGRTDAGEGCAGLQFLADQSFHDDRSSRSYGSFAFFGFQQTGEVRVREFQVYR